MQRDFVKKLILKLLLFVIHEGNKIKRVLVRVPLSGCAADHPGLRQAQANHPIRFAAGGEFF